MEETTSTHSKTGQSTITSVDKYTYNQVGALSQATNQINGGATEVIAENTYDGIGQLTQKSIGGKTNQNRLQDINYTYNVRGWLTDINNPDNKGSDLFAMRLYYDRDTHSTNATPLYNGNISQVMWSTKNTNSSKFYYFYHYDHLNRITKAQFAGGGWWDRYSLKKVEYDKNGNITKLERKGWTNSAATSFGTMDNLDYTYSSSGIGNQLLKVQDNTNINFGFKDNINQTTDYTYDSNGNMTRDYNKAINTNMTYNHLNLPTFIPINGGSINYYYDANGVKQKKVVSGGATTEYAGNHIYTNNTLDQFFTAEGYVEKDGGFWDYNYLLKDHLGNTRIIFNDNNGTASIKDENNYYPFGLEHKGYNDVVNGSEYEYKYNGKEFDQSHELDMYDYGARMYEPTLGRWMVVDPLAEDFNNLSPYNYAVNNPIFFIDPDGRAASPIYDTEGNFLGTDNEGLQGEVIVMDKEDFQQGMSHQEAVNKNKGMGGLKDWATNQKVDAHYSNLKNRPDYDGVVTIREGVEWAKSHPNLKAHPDDVNYSNATADDYLYLDASKMDFGTLNASYFENLNVKTNVNLMDHVNPFSNRSRYTTYALGRTEMTLLDSSGTVSIPNGSANAYDWNYGGSNFRNILIWGERGLKQLNDSHGFPVLIYGVGQLNNNIFLGGTPNLFPTIPVSHKK
ncbi:RHS repeat domain-containing protein [Aureicoccus marinus]|uniref:RHS repeat-associated core domain-containing protein n=1 Tax=Aureicoccus marinus TaxID=754435 RepID=A0A2S7TAA7_9FLAO|nr:RHS repeat-associated core domain-containing protein [Aureicoccus marinus]PQJ16574.1 hypothetical protein BST99_13350 [Aureicoccus marinus]